MAFILVPKTSYSRLIFVDAPAILRVDGQREKLPEVQDDLESEEPPGNGALLDMVVVGNNGPMLGAIIHQSGQP